MSSRETHHLQKVLRLKTGERCEIFNRERQGARATIQSISGGGNAELRLDEFTPAKENSLLIKVSQALPQKKKMDLLVDWASELSVQELWVTETERTIVKMKDEAGRRAKERWERIAVEASKQSSSGVLTQIEGPLSFESIVKEKIGPHDRAFLFHPDRRGIPFSEFIKNARSSVFLFLGPEGGFTEEEIEMAESSGVQKVFLGESILRLEVAFMGVLGALRFLVA